MPDFAHKVLVMTDIHITKEGRKIIGLDPMERLKAALNHALEAHPDAACLVITGDLTPIWEMAPGKVAMRHDWVEKRKGRPTGHGSVFRFDPALHGYLYDELATDTYKVVEEARGSEQRYTSHKAMEKGDFAYIPEDLVVSYKYDCLGLPPVNYLRDPILPENARVVCFHGRPKMPEAIAGYTGSLIRYSRPCAWLQDHWVDRARADLGEQWA